MGLRGFRGWESGSVVWDSIVKGFGARRQKTSRARPHFSSTTKEGRHRLHTVGADGSPSTPDGAPEAAKRLLGTASRAAQVRAGCGINTFAMPIHRPQMGQTEDRDEASAGRTGCLSAHQLSREPGSQFGWLPSGQFRRDSFETLAQPSVPGIGGMAWMPIHRFVDVGEIERRLH